jgi:ubiquinone/menaquinone biosynthesis C-methylase UbiE
VPDAPAPAPAPVAADNQSMTSFKSDSHSDEAENKDSTNVSKVSPALPSKEILDLQSSWLAPARSRLLRRIAIAGKSRILDLGAGYGQGSVELARRSSGMVTAFDMSELPLREMTKRPTIVRIAGSATRLSFRSNTFDMIFSQCALLWIRPLQDALNEIARVLEPAGVLVALEPDYEAMIEYPPEISTREIWLDALIRSGADPRIGRKLPGLLAALGFSVRVNQLEQIQQPSPQRFEFLEGLPLTKAERAKLQEIRRLASSSAYGGWQQISHLPFFLITAVKPGSKSFQP